MKKKERFGFLLTREEKIALKRLAEREGGLSAAALLRRLIRQTAQKQGVWPLSYFEKGGVELNIENQ